jgi:hypothetical protein
MMFGFKIPAAVGYALAGLGLAAAILGLIWLMTAHAAETAREACNAHWQAQIAKVNEQVALAKLVHEQDVTRLQDEARTKANDFQRQFDELEHANAALPDTTCGIEHDRVRLLRR